MSDTEYTARVTQDGSVTTIEMPLVHVDGYTVRVWWDHTY